MVADAKRRDARKRKFGAGQDVPAGLLLKTTPRHKSGIASTKKRAKLNDNAVEPLPQKVSDDPEDNVIDPEDPGTQRSPKVARFICFVGRTTFSCNLPFSATEASVAQHFAKLQPRAIRHRTTKETGKSKGFAFVEFDGYDRMKTCLQMYHHSDFNDGLSPVRKINVELTAGGGGAKSEERKSKLSNKNERLNEQRKRRTLEEEKAAPAILGLSDHYVTDPADESAIHPSRRNMVTRG
ncbi:hypothetical protein MMC17_009920 [Xylographa soralifera]|nr:hypothetical protein [Xylographa soralifera]